MKKTARFVLGLAQTCWPNWTRPGVSLEQTKNNSVYFLQVFLDLLQNQWIENELYEKGLAHNSNIKKYLF